LKLNFRLAFQDFSSRDDLKNDSRLARNGQSRINPLLNYKAISSLKEALLSLLSFLASYALLERYLDLVDVTDAYEWSICLGMLNVLVLGLSLEYVISQ